MSPTKAYKSFYKVGIRFPEFKQATGDRNDTLQEHIGLRSMSLELRPEGLRLRPHKSPRQVDPIPLVKTTARQASRPNKSFEELRLRRIEANI